MNGEAELIQIDDNSKFLAYCRLTIIQMVVNVYSNYGMKKKYPAWYKTVGLKHVVGFLTAAEKQKLKKIAQGADKSVSRYITRLLQQHIREMEEESKEDGR